jgi:hypothetical protein
MKLAYDAATEIPEYEASRATIRTISFVQFSANAVVPFEKSATVLHRQRNATMPDACAGCCTPLVVVRSDTLGMG